MRRAQFTILAVLILVLSGCSFYSQYLDVTVRWPNGGLPEPTREGVPIPERTPIPTVAPLPTSTLTVTPTPAPACIVRLTAYPWRANVRACGDLSCRVVGVVANRSQVEIINRMGEWYETPHGWIYAGLVRCE